MSASLAPAFSSISGRIILPQILFKSKVLDLMSLGRLTPIIHSTFPLASAGEAHKLMESRQFFGRMILDV